MTDLRSDFLRTIVERQYMHQCTDLEALDAKAASGEPIVAYIGFDCTAPSLHAGSLVQIMMLHHLQQTGHKPVVLMGGGTTKVGDPSGKEEQRQLLSEEKINENMDGIREVFKKFLTFGDGPTDAIMVNNNDWLEGINYIDFLRDYGRHFSVNRMLAFDSVKMRLEREQSLTFLEFNYMILQAYDFLELGRRNNCSLQMGGSDQWGNIVNGVELARRVEQRQLYGLTTPLLTTASGAKMGKTAKGAVWLNEDMLSTWDYWQYWRNTEDADVGRFLRLFTTLPMAEIARLEALEGAELNDAKKILANAATTMCHGADAARTAEETARKTFEQGGADEGLPTFTLAWANFGEGGIAAFELFRIVGITQTGGEARRLIKGGGARLNGVQIKQETQLITRDDCNADGIIKLSAGKKRHYRVKSV